MVTRRSSVASVDGRLHRSETVQLPPSGELRVVLISDTHSKAHAESVKHVRAQKPDLLLHGGDIGDLSVLKPFAEIAPLHVVRGNIDSRGPLLFDSIDLSFERDKQSVLRVLLTHIAVYGPKLRADTRRLAIKYRCKLVACGHSHVPFIGQDRGISIINPGSIGPRRFALPIVFGVLDIKPTGLNARHINCETGEVWSP